MGTSTLGSGSSDCESAFKIGSSFLGEPIFFFPFLAFFFSEEAITGSKCLYSSFFSGDFALEAEVCSFFLEDEGLAFSTDLLSSFSGDF